MLSGKGDDGGDDRANGDGRDGGNGEEKRGNGETKRTQASRVGWGSTGSSALHAIDVVMVRGRLMEEVLLRVKRC